MDFIQADKSIHPEILREYGEVAARHLHFEDGFTLVAVDDAKIAGFASFVWRRLPSPLNDLLECFIDIIETMPKYRRQGVARGLLEMAEWIAKTKGVYQLRAWSSEDKKEALSMWAALQFGLAPAVPHFGDKEVHGYFVAKPLNKEH